MTGPTLARHAARPWLACLLVVGVVFLLPREAHTRSPAAFIDAAVARAVARVEASSDAEAYAALRRLWRLWETADPSDVERALVQLSLDRRRSAPPRAYAGLLSAYARRRRGDLAGARKRIAELGYLDRWLVVGPFDNDNKAGIDELVLPEKERSQPIIYDRAFVGKAHPVRWRVSPDVHVYGYVDFGAMMRPREAICAVATNYLRGKPRPMSLWMAARGAFRLYFNDRLVLKDPAYRQLDAERHAVQVNLLDGTNRITVKVCGANAPPAFALRLAERDGEPAKGIVVAADQEASVAYASAASARGKPTTESKRPLPFGPLAELERAVKARPSDPAAMEAWAGFLLRTGADPEGEHLARDWASRAAVAEPRFERAMLAAELAEDRNGRRQWLDRAAPLASKNEQKVALWMARGRLARAGSQWRDAVPFYDRVLTVDPHHAQALLGKFDLYVEAGLSRTALGLLRDASEKQPHCVALLRALAGQLRSLGRETEALEAARRYAALRFDDGGYLKEQMDLAVARRDKAAATHWAGRLLASEPSSLWAHGTVARAQWAQGETDEAEKTYRRGLAIAPHDRATLRALASLYGELGRRRDQIRTLERVLRVAPHDKQVRKYLEHLDPRALRADERHAWPAERFLAQRESKQASGRRVLRKLHVTTVYDNGMASRFRQLVFQPQDEESARRARQFVFVYHADRQLAQLRAAKVYRKDGRVDEATRSFQAPLNDPSINMYTLQRRFVVELPPIEVGDIVELRYRIDDVVPQSEMSGHFGEVEYIQGVDPIEQAEYILTAPDEKKLSLSVNGLKLRERDSKQLEGHTRDRLVFSDVPPVAREDRMPPLAELAGHIHVSSFQSWKKLGAWYARLSRDKLDVDDAVRKRAQDLTAGLSSVRQKVAAIYHYVSSELRYVALEFGIEGIRPRRAALTLARGWGDCKDKATLIVSLLRELGIEAELVLVRTSLRGGVATKTPSLAVFDHAIAYIPVLDLYLDGTAELTGTSELPLMDRGALGLRITSEGGRLVRLPHAKASETSEQREVELSVTAEGLVRFRGVLTVRGADASRWRRRYLAEATRQDRLASDWGKFFGSVKLLQGQTRVGPLAQLERAVRLEVSGTAVVRRDGDAYVVPVGRGWRMSARFAGQIRRRQPVVLGAKRVYGESWKLTVPDGMRAVSVPKPARLESPLADYLRRVERKGRTIVVTSEMRMKAARVPVASYQAWRRFCQRVDAHGSPLILIAR